MKSNSLISVLTVVMFLLTGVSQAWGQAKETKEVCEQRCDAEYYEAKKDGKSPLDLCKEKVPKPTVDTSVERSENRKDMEACQNQFVTTCKKTCAGLDSQSGSKATCTAAFEKWEKVQEEATNACDGFTQKRKETKSCAERARTCGQTIAKAARGLGDGPGLLTDSENSSDKTLSAITQIYAQRSGVDLATAQKTMNGQKGITSSPACLEYSNEATEKKLDKKKTEQKAFDDDIKTASNKINELKKKDLEDSAELSEKINKIDTELAEIDADFKKKMLEVEKDKQKKLQSLHEQSQKALADVRNLNNVILNLKRKLEELQYGYQEKMVAFADDKVTTKCNESVNMAKSCFQKAINLKGAPFDKNDPCYGLRTPGRGVSGKNAMLIQLNKVRDACFENENITKNRIKFDHNRTVVQLQTDITEKTNDIKVKNEAAIQAKKNVDEELANVSKGGENEQADADKKRANLAKKLDDLKKSMEEKTKQRIVEKAQLEAEINSLALKKLASSVLPDVNGANLKDVFREANKAISVAEVARKKAEVDCGCTSGGDKTICTTLSRSRSNRSADDIKKEQEAESSEESSGK